MKSKLWYVLGLLVIVSMLAACAAPAAPTQAPAEEAPPPTEAPVEEAPPPTEAPAEEAPAATEAPAEEAPPADVEAVMSSVANISRDNCRPSLYPLIQRVDVEGRSVVAVHVERRTGPPFENNSGQCYVRVGPTKRLATPEERARGVVA